MESVGHEHEGGGAIFGAPRAPHRLVVLVAFLLAMVAVPVVMAGSAGAVPSVPRLKTVACDGGTYRVVAGDSWYRIAGKLGVAVTALIASNNATTATWLFAGDVLCVPAGTGTATTVRPTATTTTAIATTTTTTIAPSTSVPFKGTVVIRQFPVQGVCWYMDTWGAPRSGGRRHEGVDILANQGKNVYAVDAGTLTKQYVDRPGALAGNGWRLTRADGTYFFYGHFSGFAAGLKVGSKVAAGQIIGYVGETGNAGAPHLHFEVHPGGGAAVNPTPVVRALDGCATTKVPLQPGATPAGVTTTTAKPVTTTTGKPVTTTTKAVTSTTAKPVPTTTTKPVTTTTAKPVPTTTTGPPAPAPAARWEFVSPVMALDTGATGRALSAGADTKVSIATLTGVSATTRGVLVRVVARRVTTAGHLTLHECGSSSNGAASLTFTPGALAATVAAAPVKGGTFCVSASTSVDVRIAVIAQQSTSGVGMVPIGARRALDTRSSGILRGGTTRAITTTQLGAPASAKAVTVTVTLLGPAADGGFGIGACGGTPWIVAFTKSAAQTFSAVVRSNSAGVCVSSSVDVQAIIDVTGVWTGSGSLAVTAPLRLFDSRPTGLVGASTVTARLAVPGGRATAQLNVSVLSGGAAASVTLWNCADRRPSGAVAYVSANSRVTVTA
ncbi:MAG: hypothetical protein RJA49_2818, partial [Actinomycetota bacterium]